jgi:hypothetical protein
MESREARISAMAALNEPTRRRLYDYVVRQPAPVSRDDTAAALELPRTTARATLDQHAYQLGKELGETARSEAGNYDIETPPCGYSRHTASNRVSRATTSYSPTAPSTPWRRSTPNSCAE